MLTRTNNYLSNITGEIQKLQKFTGEHQQFKISLGETQITNTHQGGRKSKPISPGTDFVGFIFTGELSGVDSTGLLRQGVLDVLLYHQQNDVIVKDELAQLSDILSLYE